MSCHSSPIPFISISPAPEEDPIVEPFSPFSALSFPPSDQDAFRPSHLTPPTTITSFKRSFSSFHLTPAVGKGLESQKFQVLLAASKQRKASGGSNQSVEFRKEIAMKAHRNGHSDRRALFLSKLQAPPSPTATTTSQKLLPESPGIFSDFLSSPGLESSSTLFDSWSGNHADDVPHTWLEHDDFDERSKSKPSLNRLSTKPARGLPSLDQISARFSRPVKLDDVKMTCDALTTEHSPRPSVGIGRLRMPLRTPLRTQVILQSDNQPKQYTPSKPLLPLSLEPSTQSFVISRSTPTQLTESNLNSLNSRDQKASNMLFTLRKRKLSSEFNPTCQETAIDLDEGEATDKLKWRRSAPADMTPLRARFGFEHPVFASPGGF